MNELFNQTQIKAMLEQYHELDTTHKELIDRALSSDHLDGYQLLYISTTHNFGLTNKQTAQLLDVPMKSVVLTLSEAYETLEALLNGYKSTYKKLRQLPANDFKQVPHYLAVGKYHPFTANEEYLYKMLEVRAQVLNDHSAKVALGYERDTNEPLPNKPLKIYDEAPNGVKKTKGNDGFYNQDQLNNVTLRGGEYHE